MKNLNSRITIVTGIIVAGLVFFNISARAEINDSETINKEHYAMAEALINEMAEISDMKSEAKKVFKVYNSENKLVYESRNIHDAKLKSLIHKSDLLTSVDQEYYYKLAH